MADQLASVTWRCESAESEAAAGLLSLLVTNDAEEPPKEAAPVPRDTESPDLVVNPDQLGEGEHCASTSNRNFEGRQGYGGRTHLVSPAMAAAAAINGRFVDIRNAQHQQGGAA